jgi:hypothetical protein
LAVTLVTVLPESVHDCAGWQGHTVGYLGNESCELDKCDRPPFYSACQLSLRWGAGVEPQHPKLKSKKVTNGQSAHLASGRIATLDTNPDD